jgi:hypothetical protein
LLSQTTLVLISSAPYLCSSLISSRSHFKASNYYYPKNAATNSCFLQLPEFCLVYLASCRARVTVAYFFWSRVQISTTRHQMTLFCLAHFFFVRIPIYPLRVSISPTPLLNYIFPHTYLVFFQPSALYHIQKIYLVYNPPSQNTCRFYF